MRTNKYPSEVTDAPGRLIERLIPVYPGGRPRTMNLRDGVDAVCYVRRTGCPGRYLPQDFPPQSTGGRSVDACRHHGTLEAIHEALREKVHKKEGKKRTPNAGSSDR